VFTTLPVRTVPGIRLAAHPEESLDDLHQFAAIVDAARSYASRPQRMR